MSDRNSKNVSLLVILLVVVCLSLGVKALLGTYNKAPFYTNIRDVSG